MERVNGEPVVRLGSSHGTDTGRASECGSRTRVRDPDRARELVTEAFLPIRVLPPASRDEFLMELAEVRMSRMTAGVLSLGTAARMVSAETEQVHLNLALRGRAAWRLDGAAPVVTARGSGVVVNPEQVADTLWSDGCDHLCLMITREALESEVEALTGRSVRTPISFAPSLGLEGLSSRLLAPVCELLVSELHDPRSTLGLPAVGRHLEGLVLDGLLLGHRHNHSELLHQPGPVSPSPVGRAVELLEERPEHPWTTVGLAREVHLSVRALQEGFRRQHDLAPMAYLRRVRLRRAREVLVAALPGSVQVQEVAVRFGFLHLGRFSAAYRQAYGELPSTALARPPG